MDKEAEAQKKFCVKKWTMKAALVFAGMVSVSLYSFFEDEVAGFFGLEEKVAEAIAEQDDEIASVGFAVKENARAISVLIITHKESIQAQKDFNKTIDEYMMDIQERVSRVEGRVE